MSPPPRLTVSEWAEAERRLSPEASAEAGWWNTDRAAYQRGIMDCINDPAIENIVIMSAAQIGKTEILLNILQQKKYRLDQYLLRQVSYLIR